MSETAKLYDPNSDFDLKKKLGEGSFGAVYYAINKHTGEELAVKRLNVNDQKALEAILKEIDLMKGIDNQYIVHYFANYFFSKQIWIVMEFCGAGSLSDVLDKFAKVSPPRGFRDENRIKSVGNAILRGLSFMHGRGVVHRDIKSDNILITAQGKVKLADFGISRRISEHESRMHTMIGTPHYLAPEVLRAEAGQGYTSKVDIWAFGTVCLEMADGKPPYAHLGPIKVLFELSNNPKIGLKNPAQWSTQFNHFTQVCCIPDPDERAGTDQLLIHPFLNGAAPALDLSAPNVASGQAPSSPAVGHSSPAPWRGAAGVAVMHGDNEVSSLDNVQKMDAPATPAKPADHYGYWEPGVVFKNVNREQAEVLLQQWGIGTYLVRPSSQKSCLSCTYRVGAQQSDTGRIGHLLLSKNGNQGWTTDGRPVPYKNIRLLLESLPYGLKLDAPN